MNRTAYLYRPLLIPSALLLLILSFFVVEFYFLDNEKRTLNEVYQAQVQQVDALYTEVNEVRNKIELFNTYFSQFERYQSQGYLDQSRVNWLDRLIEIRGDYNVHAASFGFSRRQPLPSNQLATLRPYAEVIQHELVEIEGQLQHETEVFHFMDDVLNKVNPLATIDSCSLSSLNTKNAYGLIDDRYAFHADRGNVAFSCKIKFLALQLTKLSEKTESHP